MPMFASPEFLAGVCAAAIVLSALFASRIFRTFALVAAALGIFRLYTTEGGIPAIVKLEKLVETDLTMHHPAFGLGLVGGCLLAIAISVVASQRSPG